MINLPPNAPDNFACVLDGYEKWLIATTFRDTWNACLAEVQRLNATAQPVSDGWVKCSERMPPVKTAIIVGKWNGRLWATKWSTYIPSHPEANSFGYIMPGGSWEPDFWMEVPAAPGGQ